MKRLLVAVILVALARTAVGDGEQTAVYMSNGGNSITVASGGTMTIDSGGTLTVAGTSTFSGTITLTPTDTEPSGTEGMIYWDDSENILKVYTAGAWTALVTAAGNGNTLDEAYDQGGAGAGRTINATDGAVVIANTDADATNILELNKSPSGSAAGSALAITAGANATGAAIAITNAGSGNDITGTSSTWSVTKAGAATFTSLTAGTVYQSAIVAAAAGNQNLTIDAAGNGTITIGGTSTGNLILPGAVVANGNVDIGNAATDTLTITSIIDSNITLDDGVTDSPALIFKDATDETVTISKVDGAHLGITSTATEGVKVLTGNLWVGNGSPGTAAMDGEDFYVNGDAEFDGAVQCDGAVTAASTVDFTAAVLQGASPIVMEGTTANDFETTIAVTDPTADRTVTLADASGTVMLSSLATNAPDAANAVTGASNALVLEGATANDFETSLTPADPTADRTVTLADASGTIMLSALATNAPDAANSVTGASNALAFEGATANDFETSITPADPTADNTVTLADASGTIMLSALATNAPDAANSVTGASNALVFKGATANDFETSIAPTDPTADRTITLPDASGTVALIGKTITAKADEDSPFTVTSAYAGQILTNGGADDALIMNLPEASTVIGKPFTFVVAAAQNFDLNPDDADQILVLTNAVGDAVRSATVGNTVTLMALDATNWVVLAVEGTLADVN